MKKIHLIVYQKDIVPSLEKLRDLGVLHVEHLDDVGGFQIEERREERREEVEILQKVISQLKDYALVPDQKTHDDWREVCNIVLELNGQVSVLKEAMDKRAAQITRWELWGNFNTQDIESLKSRGFVVQLFELSGNQKINWPAGSIVEEVSKTGGMTRFVVISQEPIKLAIEEIMLPAHGLDELKAQQKQAQKTMAEHDKKLKAHAAYLSFLEQTFIERSEVLNFEEVQEGMKEEERVSLLKGFCPVDQVSRLEEESKRNHWGLLVENPSDDDQIPVLMRNPKWVNVISPVFKLINILPGYKEVDISPIFLFFFALFFGMLIGDAGYGVIFFLLTLFAQVKAGAKAKGNETFALMYILSGCTIIWGVLTGVYFGQKWIAPTIPALVPWLNDQKNIQQLCFIIAATHLTIAHGWLLLRKFPSLAFLQDLGWIAVVWVMFFMTGYFVLGNAVPNFLVPLLIAGIILIIVFPKPKFDPLLPLNIINCFTDSVSYIRLFAVGLATVAVADAANDMSLFWIIFLHTLNIVLACMAILVHGLRLNVLEFSGHLGMEWSGFHYSPFTRLRKN